MPEPVEHDVRDAETHFSRLLARVEAGDEIVLTRAGRPVAKLVPVPGARLARVPGAWQGRVTIRADFDELPADVMAVFLGRST